MDKAIPRNSDLAKPGKEGVGPEAPWNVEEQVLLPLLLEEKRLLAYYGPQHPDVLSIRERIKVVREHLAKHPPAPPATIPAPLPPISVQTPYREVPSTTAQTPPSPLPPVRSQSLETGGTEGGAAAKDRDGSTHTVTARSCPETIRPASFSTAGNPMRDPDTVPASLAARPPTVVEKREKSTHPAAKVSTNPPAKTVVSPPSNVGDNSAHPPSQEQRHSNSFFETGFGLLIGIVGGVLLGVLIHLIVLVLILRTYRAHHARVFRVELVNGATVGFVGQESAAGAQTLAASPATTEVTQSSTAETFDIGPTYAEEMQQKQQAEKQQEQAMLRHIFELNMQMREQLGQRLGGAE